ncbi:MAG: hypothetical protein ACXQS5_05440 [Candidatus Methanospirareceae archaeon]
MPIKADPVIKRVQFTAYDRHMHPEINNDEYLEYELLKTGLSTQVCSFGWIEIDAANGEYRWVKLSEATK